MHRKLIRDAHEKWFEVFEKLKEHFLKTLELIDKKCVLQEPELDLLMKYYSRVTRLLTALQNQITPEQIEEGKDNPNSIPKQVSHIVARWEGVNFEVGAIVWKNIPIERSCWLLTITERTLRYLSDYLHGNCM
jgi:hypothetical protein